MEQPAQPEFWRWSETRWTNPAIDPLLAKCISAGIDVGSISSQAVILADGNVYAYGNLRTGVESGDSAVSALEFAVSETPLKIKDIHYCIGTGYGRVNVPFADKTLTEIACHAKGAHYIFGPTVRTVLDVGGQDVKVIRCNEKGKVLDFILNDKCAAGTGRGMEVMADLLSIPIAQVGDLSLSIETEPAPVSSTCVVYAKSEATDLLRKGKPKNEVLAAYCGGMADRIYALMKRVGIEKDFVITGGLSKNRGIVERLSHRVGFQPLSTPWDSQLAGAIGAGIFAYAACIKGKASPAALRASSPS